MDEPLKLRRKLRHGDSTCKDEKTDFVIKVEDVTIPVHKDFLCTVSEYFRVMVASGMTESDDGVLNVMNTKPHVVETIIKYLYGEKVSIPWDGIKDYVDFAELWQLSELKSSLEAYIFDHVSLSNCVEWYYFASMYHMKHLKLKAKVVLRSDIVEAFTGEYFKSLEYDELVDFIKDKELLSPSAALEVSISWTLTAEPRRPMFEKLLTYVENHECNPARLNYLLRQRLVTSPLVCKDINDIVTSSIIFIPNKFMLLFAQKVLTLDTNKFATADISEYFSRLPFYKQADRVFHVKTPAGIFTTWRHSESRDIQCVLWDPVTLKITHLPPLPGSSGGRTPQAASIDNKLWVMSTTISRHSIVHLDVTKSCERWEELELPERVARVERCHLCSEGKFLVIVAGNEFDDVELLRYDEDNGWLTTMATPRACFNDLFLLTCVVPAQGSLYLIGNFRKRVDGESKGLQKVCLCYNIARDKWTERRRPPEKSKLKKAFYLESRGEIYDFIGSESMHENRIQVYNIAADRWRVIPCAMQVNIEDSFIFSI